MSETVQIINEAGMLKLAMTADTEPGKRVRDEIIAIVKAWRRGRLLPRSEAPMLQRMYGIGFEFDLDAFQRPGVGGVRHQEIEGLAKDLFPGVSGQGEEGVIGKNDRIAGFVCIGENHRHSCRLGGNHERAEVVVKALDLGFGILLLFGLGNYLRHIGYRSRPWWKSI